MESLLAWFIANCNELKMLWEHPNLYVRYLRYCRGVCYADALYVATATLRCALQQTAGKPLQ
jgi:hypothetical protein